MSTAKVALGELLFNSRTLSVNGTMACATCHQISREFTDGLERPVGALGEQLAFNTPTLWNAAYSASFSWVDKGLTSLAEQHLGPLTNDSPVELGVTPETLARVAREPEIAAAHSQAFPGESGLTLTSASKALASYVRSLIRGDSPLDRLLFDDQPDALTPEERVGLSLFSSTRLGCTQCHRGFLLSGPTRSARAEFPATFYVTGVPTRSEERAFRAPSLRFVSGTAPYMHNGSMASLDEVLTFYAGGGGEGSERLRPFTLSAAERRAVLAFLKVL